MTCPPSPSRAAADPAQLAATVESLTQTVFAMDRRNAEVEARLRQSVQELAAAQRDLEVISSSIAHDLRAPLASIDGFSQALEANAGPLADDKAAHYLQRIRAGVRQMSELTDGLLALSHVSRAAMRIETVDLADLARNAFAPLRESAPAREAQIEIAPAMPVRGDPVLLGKVIENLVGNAWKFTASRQRTVIQVGCTPAGDGGMTFHVRDNGAGFDMAYASQMFGAFQRLHGPAEFEGRGMGLAVVHKIVTRHGGQIRAESAPGQGATFYFTLGATPTASPS